MPVEALLGLKVTTAAGATALSLLVGLGAPPLLAIAPLLAVVAFRLPDMALARVGNRRQRRIAARVPDLVELLLVTTEAGLSPPLALERSTALIGGPLGDELRTVSRAIQLGMPWREALDRLARRAESPPVRRLVLALTRSQRLGTSVSSALRGVVDELRAERRAQAEEEARRAPVKMLFPLVFLILPAFLLLTVGPVLLATIRSLR